MFNNFFLLIKSLIKVYAISDNKLIRDIPHGIIIMNGIIISILVSLFVQLLFIDKYRYNHQYYLSYTFISY